MQTIKLNISDNIFKQFMGLIEILPKGSIEIESSEDFDPYFNDRKKIIQKRLNDIDSGNLKTTSFQEFEDEMDEFEKELERKYAN